VWKVFFPSTCTVQRPMSSRIRRLLKLANADPEDHYNQLLRATTEIFLTSKYLAKHENTKHSRCPVCQEPYLTFHNPLSHESYQKTGMTRAEFNAAVKATEADIKAGRFEYPDIKNISPILKVLKALAFDIEAAIPAEAVTGSETWRMRWMEKVKRVMTVQDMSECLHEMAVQVRNEWLDPDFNMRTWISKLHNCSTPAEIYPLLQKLDENLRLEDVEEEALDHDTKARPLRKMARPELAVKWGYIPGKFYSDRKSGITGRALHVQDGRLVIEVVHPPRQKGKMRRYTMGQAKQWLGQVTNNQLASELAKLSGMGTGTNEKTINLEGYSLKASSYLSRKLESNKLFSPLEACKELLSNVLSAMNLENTDSSAGPGEAIGWKIGSIRESLSASASHEGIQRCLLEARSIIPDLKVDRRWALQVRGAKDEKELLPLIVQLDKAIPYETIKESLLPNNQTRKRTHLRLKKRSNKDTQESEGMEVELPDSANALPDTRSGSWIEFSNRHKSQCNASRLLQEGKKPYLPMFKIRPSGGKHQIAIKIILRDMLLMIPPQAFTESFDRSSVKKRLMEVANGTIRSLATLALDFESNVREEYLQSWHETELWEKECRSNRSAERLMDLILRLDSAILYDGPERDVGRRPSRSPPPTAHRSRRKTKTKDRPTRPDLAIKWGYQPGAKYYDSKVEMIGKCLYVQAGNLVVQFDDKPRRYCMDDARTFLHRQGNPSTFEELQPQYKKRGLGRKGAPRPTNGANYRYSEEANYVASIRAWSLKWIEVISTGCTIRAFYRVELERGPFGDFAVWMLLRTGEGRGGRCIAYLLDFKTNKVGSVELGSVSVCKEKCNAREINALKEWQSNLRRRPFTPDKITPPRGPQRNKRTRRGFDLSDRPLRRSRRQELMLGISREDDILYRQTLLENQTLKSKLEEKSRYIADLIEENEMFRGRLLKYELPTLDVVPEHPPKKSQSMVTVKDGMAITPKGVRPITPKKVSTDARLNVMTDASLLCCIFSFLDMRDRIKMSSVTSLWNTPYINQKITTIDFVNLRKQATDSRVMSVALKHLMIDTICLEHCEKLTDAAVIELSQLYGKALTYVNLSYCPLLTDAAIYSFDRCRQLRTLIVIGCDKISEL